MLPLFYGMLVLAPCLAGMGIVLQISFGFHHGAFMFLLNAALKIIHENKDGKINIKIMCLLDCW